jgi:transcriptional regulator with XRE-family HTH domain
VRALRAELGHSQSSFARALNVSLELVQSWEAGRRRPQGAALRLLELVRANPALVFAESGRARLRELTPTHVRSQRMPFEPLIRGLAEADVRFILIGGVAGHCHGAPGEPDDLDILYDRDAANLERLAKFLRGIGATLRGARGAPPFAGDARTLAHTAAMAFETDAGPLDIRQRVTGIGEYGAALEQSEDRVLGLRMVRVLTLPALIAARRAAGRPRDREMLVALERLRGEG